MHDLKFPVLSVDLLRLQANLLQVRDVSNKEKNVAEDLGIVTDEVRAAIAQTGYLGMKILQHAFGGDADCEHKPSNFSEHNVVYTGTHDNETLFQKISATTGEAGAVLKKDLIRECGQAGIHPKLKNNTSICNSILSLLYA